MNANGTELSDKISHLKKMTDITCPSGWIDQDGTGCFYFGTSTMSWKEARNYCKSLNPWADLAEIHNEETNTFLHSIIKEKSFDYWWIGGSDEKEVSDNHLNFFYKFSKLDWQIKGQLLSSLSAFKRPKC